MNDRNTESYKGYELAPGTPDKSRGADARRFRWLVSGKGYFLEHLALCGHDSRDEDLARKVIDAAMKDEHIITLPTKEYIVLYMKGVDENFGYVCDAISEQDAMIKFQLSGTEYSEILDVQPMKKAK